MNVSYCNSLEHLYERLKTELQICNIGGLFLSLFQDEDIPYIVIDRLKSELPDYFVLSIQMHERKVGFPTFFDSTFSQIGKRSNIFHVLGIEKLEEKERLSFFNYLQYNRERFRANPYSLVFWISPQFEKELFIAAPDFYHWVFGTYDFSRVGQEIQKPYSELSALRRYTHDIPFEKTEKLLKKAIWQYDHWQEVKRRKENFFIRPMKHSNLNQYYVQSFCTDKDGKMWRLNDLLNNFISDHTKNFLTLLGDFGTGKTSFSIHYYVYLARNYLKNKKGRIPIFVSLSNYPGKLNIEDFIVTEFYEKFGIEIDFSIFQDLALKGNFFFIIDGFDEMVSRSDRNLTIENLRELTKLTFENLQILTKESAGPFRANKVLLTCRTHYFLTEVQEKKILRADYTILYRNYVRKTNYEITRINLKEFDDEQIAEYIFKSVENKETADRILSIIKATYNLEELSTRPILLEMIIKSLPILGKEKRVDASDLYKAYTNVWVERDDWRSQMTLEGKRALMWELALKMFKKGDLSIHYTNLTKPDKKYFKKSVKKKDADFYRYEITTCTFLNRDSRGNYAFLHKSFMEYFLAEYLIWNILNYNNLVLECSSLNKETQYFFKVMLSKENLAKDGLDLSGLNFEQTDLKDVDLRKANLENTNLKNADLSNSNLGEANLKEANLYNVSLRRCKIDRTIFYKAILQNSDLYEVKFRSADLRKSNLIGANLSRATLIGCNMRGANLKGANLREARLIGCDISRANFKDADMSHVSRLYC